MIVVVFLVSAVVYGVATYAQTYLVGWVGQRALQDLRRSCSRTCSRCRSASTSATAPGS